MAEKKKLVIKIKRPQPGLEADIQPALVTHWHKPRIFMAVAVALVLLAGLYYWLAKPESGQQTPARQLAVETGNIGKPQAQAELPPPAGQAETVHQAVGRSPTPPPAVVTEAKESQTDKPAVAQSKGWIKRAVLTHSLDRKKPGKAMPATVIVSGRKPFTVYYFTEARDLAGQILYHQWLHDGKAVARYRHKVGGQRWRLVSRRLITAKARGTWRVKTVDGQGRLLNEQGFKVE